ncbi:MAG: dihydropteroate synthase [Oligoflexia bacterium]|nr:dihydropteroate synthase [Oligoflexia bacterium]
MNQITQRKFKVINMGVANVTPNSFSDGSKYNDHQSLKAHIEDLVNRGATIIDIGAESTAPFNEPITQEMEIERYENIVIPVLKEIVDKDRFKNITWSFDTYRFDVANFLANEFRDIRIIWNDVSGVNDEAIIEFLKKHQHTQYVFSFTHVPTRERTSFHMDYLKDDIETSWHDWLNQALNSKLLIDYPQRVFLDPCFGFSKSYEQNMWLLDELAQSFLRHPKWLIGISKKSFLRKTIDPNSETPKEELLSRSEVLHQRYLEGWIRGAQERNFIGELAFRVHDPEIISRF